MANAVMVLTKATCTNVDAYNGVGILNSAIQNGTPLKVTGVSTDANKGEVFTVAATSAATDKGLWLAYSPEVNVTVSGALEFKGIDSDPRNFVNVANKPFDMFYLNAGVDMIQVTKEFFDTSKDPATVTGATVVELNANGKFEAKVSGTSNYAGTGFKILKKEPIVIANGALGGETVDAWILLCTQN